MRIRLIQDHTTPDKFLPDPADNFTTGFFKLLHKDSMTISDMQELLEERFEIKLYNHSTTIQSKLSATPWAITWYNRTKEKHCGLLSQGKKIWYAGTEYAARTHSALIELMRYSNDKKNK